MKKILLKISPILSVALIIMLWQIIASSINSDFLMPSFSLVFSEIIECLKNIYTYQCIATSLYRTIIAFLLAFICAIILAFISYKSVFFERFLYPFVVVMRATPTMSIIFLSVIWLTSAQSPVLVCFLITFPSLYVSFLTSIRGVDKGLIEMSKIYNVKKGNAIVSLYLPSIANKMYGDCVTTLSLGVKLVISGEAISQTRDSVGILLQRANGGLETGQLIAYSLIAIAISYALELVIFLFKKAIVRFYYAKII